MSAMNHAHQQGLFNPAYAKKVILLGAGSVGSHVAYHLAKLGVQDLEVWDEDNVASHNAPMSLYGPEDTGRYKVDALQELIKRLTGLQITTRRQMYAGESLSHASVVACVDKMSTRKLIWEKVKMVSTVDLFVDTRTASWYLEILAVSPHEKEDIDNYESLLFGDEKASRQMCGRHGVISVSSRAGEVVATKLARFWQSGKREWRFGERCDTLDRVF